MFKSSSRMPFNIFELFEEILLYWVAALSWILLFMSGCGRKCEFPRMHFFSRARSFPAHKWKGQVAANPLARAHRAGYGVSKWAPDGWANPLGIARKLAFTLWAFLSAKPNRISRILWIFSEGMCASSTSSATCYSIQWFFRVRCNAEA